MDGNQWEFATWMKLNFQIKNLKQMKKALLSAVTGIYFVIHTAMCFAQASIPYGSNDGKYGSVKGVKIYYEEYGQGTPLLLIHGGLSSSESFAPLIPDLSRKFRVIVVDCPGQGRSEQQASSGNCVSVTACIFYFVYTSKNFYGH